MHNGHFTKHGRRILRLFSSLGGAARRPACGVPPAASEVPPGVPPAAIARHHLYIMLMASFIVDVIIIHYYEFL